MLTINLDNKSLTKFQEKIKDEQVPWESCYGFFQGIVLANAGYPDTQLDELIESLNLLFVKIQREETQRRA